MTFRIQDLLKAFGLALGGFYFLLYIQQCLWMLQAQNEALLETVHAQEQQLTHIEHSLDKIMAHMKSTAVHGEPSDQNGRKISIPGLPHLPLRQRDPDQGSLHQPAEILPPDPSAGKQTIQSNDHCYFLGPSEGFMADCIGDCKKFDSLDGAKNACLELPRCLGITTVRGGQGFFELRSGSHVQDSPEHEEKSWPKVCPNISPPEDIPPPPDYKPPSEVAADLDSVGSYVDGQPTIFIGIASYRDELCHNTINDALRRATHPSRVFFGAVEQNIKGAGDVPCDYVDEPCEKNPEQMLCQHAHQIQIHRVDARMAQGPTWGRHRADRLYRGEYFALQLDAHMYFVRNWDTLLIAQWNATGNEYAVLSTYPSEVTGAIDQNGDQHRTSTPMLCDSHFSGRMVKHNPAGEITPVAKIVGKSPVLQPLWAAGISFSRGHRLIRVPYDCCLGMMFDGEEFSMAVRMWTHGYDFYSPHDSVTFHPYNRKSKPKLFWENNERHHGAADRAVRRVLALIGVDPQGKYDTTELDGKYGLGKRRSIKSFMRLFGYDFEKQTVRGNCNWVYSEQMHQELVPFIGKDKKGIDYDRADIERLLQKYFPGGKESEVGMDFQARGLRRAEHERAKRERAAYK